MNEMHIHQLRDNPLLLQSETRLQSQLRSHLCDEEFLQWMISLGGTPPEILANPEALKLFLPTLRADLKVVENYRYVVSAKKSVLVCCKCKKAA